MTASLQTAVTSIDWQFAADDTRYLTHSIHRYSGKYIPQVARAAIELVSDEHETVLDPYCGSGTTLLEAALAKRRSFGIDMNPLAVLISQVKTTPLDISSVNHSVQALRAKLSPLFERQRDLFSHHTGEPAVLEAIDEDPRLRDPWFAKWFQPHALRQLIAIHQEIEALSSDSLRRLGLVAFSDILRRASNAHGSYPNVMFDRKKGMVDDPWRHFIERFETIGLLVASLPQFPEGILPEVSEGDATALEIEDDSVDAIVTHPPYIGSVPYAEYGLLSLKWLGCEPRELDGRLTGGRRQTRDVVQRFRTSYAAMLRESHRVLRPGRHLFLLVGSPTVKGNRIDLAQMSRELADEAGFTVAAEAIRPGLNRRANLMGAESVLFFQK